MSKLFIVHLQLGNPEHFGETEVTLEADNLDEAHELADKLFPSVEITRIRPNKV